MRPRRILAIIDGTAKNEFVIDRVARIAADTGASVELLSAVEEAPWYARVGFPHADDIREALTEHRLGKLASYLAALREKGIAATSALGHGRMSEVAVRVATGSSADLVVKAADAIPAVSLTTEDMFLTRDCPCPVLLLRPGAPAPFGRVLAAVELSASESGRNRPGHHDPSLDRNILDLAASFVSPGGTLAVLHAWEVPGEDLLRSETLLSGEQIDEYIANAEATAREALDGLLAQAPPVGANRIALLAKGPAAEEIPAAASRVCADLVVVGTVGRHGVLAFLTGNTAETILPRVGCSVLVAKPVAGPLA